MEVVRSREHRDLAREVAEKGMVLLENNGVLPLDASTAVFVGSDYASTINVGDHGSSRVYDKKIVTPAEGLSHVFRSVTVANGTDVDAAKAAAKAENVAILCIGSNQTKEGEYFASTKYSLREKPENVGGDRANLRLTDKEIALIKALKAEGKQVIVVLYSGCAILTDEWKQYADAIIMNYYSGCEGGTALANLLCGEANFSGKLPFTVAASEDDYPPMIGIGDKPYVITYDYYHGYTLLDKEKKKAAYPFGFGLSYTSFTIDSIGIEQTDDEVIVQASVRNAGKRSGAEVAQIYIGSCGAEEHRPLKLLKGYRRVELQPNEEHTVEIRITKNDLCFYSNGTWVLDPAYNVYIGNSSADAMHHSYMLQFRF